VALVTLWFTTWGSDLHQQETKILIPVSDYWMLSIYKLSFSWHQNYTENNRKLQRPWRWWYFCRDCTLVSFIGCHLKGSWDVLMCNCQYKIYCFHCLFCTTCPFFLSLLRVELYTVSFVFQALLDIIHCISSYHLNVHNVSSMCSEACQICWSLFTRILSLSVNRTFTTTTTNYNWVVTRWQ